jgi:phosphopantetheinyl transferase (holo-ACP synthase)
MTSTGNDIVSLATIDAARTKQYKFYSKIISGAEKALYNEPGFEAIPFELFVWLLWSIKESAYKFLKRIDPELIFTPVKFEVKQINIPPQFKLVDFALDEAEGTGFDDRLVLQGILSIGVNTLYSRSLLYNEAIITVVNDTDGFDDVFWGIKKISGSDNDIQSSEVRRILFDRLRRVMDLEELTIIKNEKGVPVLLAGEKEMAIPVSLSHHDHMIAYSFQTGDR